MNNKKVYTLNSCSTCQRILKEVELGNDFEVQNIKTDKITNTQLDEMVKISGSYESLFSRRSMKYKSLGLKDKSLNEEDYKNYILEEYTFLKRPVFVIEDRIFIGNSQKTVEEIKTYLHDD